MESISYSKVQDLVRRLPATRLAIAYKMLLELAGKEADSLSPREEFMQLPLSERRRLMAKQAEQLVAHYKQTLPERELWQAGEFLDEY